jgi:hypothetical protein
MGKKIKKNTTDRREYYEYLITITDVNMLSDTF